MTFTAYPPHTTPQNTPDLAVFSAISKHRKKNQFYLHVLQTGPFPRTISALYSQYFFEGAKGRDGMRSARILRLCRWFLQADFPE